MARILSIDYGRKRTGIAVTDTLQLIANGLCTVATHDVLAFLLDYVQREPVERIIIGLPRRLDNTPSESMRYITPFVTKLRKSLPDRVFRRTVHLDIGPPDDARRRVEA